MRIRLFIILLLTSFLPAARAQSHEVQQLLLNVEKLRQLKNILEDMKQGYRIVSRGYNAIRDITQGNFSLHEVFLDGLMLVSPEVRKYHRVSGIIRRQKAILSEYRAAFQRFQSSGRFSAEELRYLASVYEHLFRESLRGLDELLMVITSSTLRMTDGERLAAIDRIFSGVEEKLVFLRQFNREVAILAGVRRAEQRELDRLRTYVE